MANGDNIIKKLQDTAGPIAIRNKIKDLYDRVDILVKDYSSQQALASIITRAQKDLNNILNTIQKNIQTVLPDTTIIKQYLEKNPGNAASLIDDINTLVSLVDRIPTAATISGALFEALFAFADYTLENEVDQIVNNTMNGVSNRVINTQIAQLVTKVKNDTSSPLKGDLYEEIRGINGDVLFKKRSRTDITMTINLGTKESPNLITANLSLKNKSRAGAELKVIQNAPLIHILQAVTSNQFITHYLNFITKSDSSPDKEYPYKRNYKNFITASDSLKKDYINNVRASALDVALSGYNLNTDYLVINEDKEKHIRVIDIKNLLAILRSGIAEGKSGVGSTILSELQRYSINQSYVKASYRTRTDNVVREFSKKRITIYLKHNMLVTTVNSNKNKI